MNTAAATTQTIEQLLSVSAPWPASDARDDAEARCDAATNPGEAADAYVALSDLVLTEIAGAEATEAPSLRCEASESGKGLGLGDLEYDDWGFAWDDECNILGYRAPANCAAPEEVVTLEDAAAALERLFYADLDAANLRGALQMEIDNFIDAIRRNRQPNVNKAARRAQHLHQLYDNQLVELGKAHGIQNRKKGKFLQFDFGRVSAEARAKSLAFNPEKMAEAVRFARQRRWHDAVMVKASIIAAAFKGREGTEHFYIETPAHDEFKVSTGVK